MVILCHKLKIINLSMVVSSIYKIFSLHSQNQLNYISYNNQNYSAKNSYRTSVYTSFVSNPLITFAYDFINFISPKIQRSKTKCYKTYSKYIT
uniref:Uncharacterized protein n=1 Tax=Mammaliicoccus fleurettii TaxID=150056 RepID=A0A0D6DTS6_9STAP|nr:putative protein [Mammaliicoccus fleurettii]